MEFIGKFKITIEDLAEKHGKKQQAIRNYIDRYPEQMQGHYKRENGSTWLDEVAVDFIESKIKPPKIDSVVFDQQLAEKIRELQDKLIEAQDKNLKLWEERENFRIQIEDNKKLIEAHEDLKQQLQSAYDRIDIEAEAADNLRKDYTQVKKELTQTSEKNIELQDSLKKAHNLIDSYEKGYKEQVAEMEQLQNDLAAAQSELENMKNRGFWKRLFNKE